MIGAVPGWFGTCGPVSFGANWFRQMPRRNLHLLWMLAVVCLACYLKTDRQTRVLGMVMSEIHDRYVEPVSSQTLFEGALDGMMSQLDEHSNYIPPRTLEEFHETIHQEFGGVGVQILLDPETKQLTVANPLVGSPAHQAGVRAGDRILRIDGESTQGLSLDDASSRMRGKLGEAVRLTVLHAGETEPITLEIVRDKVQEDAVLGDTHNANGTWNYFLEGEDKIAYLRLDSFGDKTAEEMDRVLRRLTQHGMRGLVLDMRNNPGGSLEAAIKVCQMFLDGGKRVVSVTGRDQQVGEPYETTAKGPFADVPVVVLMNRYSASASEVVAACLQDHGRAVIVGERSYGKGTVQQILELPSGQGALKLTTAVYWRPSGQDIRRKKNASENDTWGVSPNPGYEVQLTPEQTARLHRWRLQRDLYQPAGVKMPGAVEEVGLAADPQLARAVEYLQQVAAPSPSP